jgi:hypothetical protein
MSRLRDNGLGRALAVTMCALSGLQTLSGCGGGGSPRASKIAFESARDGNWEIYVMNADGSGVPVNLTNSPGTADGSPAWSPDLRLHTY